MDKALEAKLVAALDAADDMFAEFWDPAFMRSQQVAIYKAANAKVKAARRALAKAVMMEA